MRVRNPSAWTCSALALCHLALAVAIYLLIGFGWFMYVADAADGVPVHERRAFDQFTDIMASVGALSFLAAFLALVVRGGAALLVGVSAVEGYGLAIRGDSDPGTTGAFIAITIVTVAVVGWDLCSPTQRHAAQRSDPGLEARRQEAYRRWAHEQSFGQRE